MKNILIVDDSALMRRVLSDIIDDNKELNAAYLAEDGVEALEILDSGAKVDAIVLDINMPRMDGIAFLKVLNERHQREKVLIVSTLAQKGGAETIRALELGAFDFITKPTSLSEAKGPFFINMFIRMLYVATGLSTAGLDTGEEQSVPKPETQKTVFKKLFHIQKALVMQRKRGGVAGEVKADRSKHSKEPLVLGANKIVALACSTGGPKALQQVIPKLPSNLDASVVIVQHMPEGFTGSLARRLNELSEITVKEAEHGEPLRKGTVYIAKGGFQFRVMEKNKHEQYLSVTIEEARNALKPCADIMYESLMNVSCDEITCVVLTGMGSDGTDGILQLEQVKQIYVIAQDEESSTVYGMPRAIATAGAVDEVVELQQIAETIIKHVGVQ